VAHRLHGRNFLFVFFWLLTFVYVRRANGEFDDLTSEMIKEAQKEKQMMQRLTYRHFALLVLSGLAHAGPAWTQPAKQATNWHAIIMFLIFVAMTMGIT
jgi:cation/acetate symporter